MFNYIKGKIATKESDNLVIDNSGIGYLINSSFSTISNVVEGEDAIIYTYMHIREDFIGLYGFLTKEELYIFKLLISVNGVGPKAGLSIMSVATPQEFCIAVITEDIKKITKATGVGPKLAQRVILELKDKIKKQQAEQTLQNPNIIISAKADNNTINEAISALMVLGYSQFEANKSINNTYEQGIEIENLIKNALKQLAK